MDSTPAVLTGCHLCVLDNIKGNESAMKSLEESILKSGGVYQAQWKFAISQYRKAVKNNLTVDGRDHTSDCITVVTTSSLPTLVFLKGKRNTVVAAKEMACLFGSYLKFYSNSFNVTVTGKEFRVNDVMIRFGLVYTEDRVQGSVLIDFEYLCGVGSQSPRILEAIRNAVYPSGINVPCQFSQYIANGSLDPHPFSLRDLGDFLTDSVCSRSSIVRLSSVMFARCAACSIRHHAVARSRGFVRSLFNLSSCVIDNDVQTAMANGKAVLPFDSSVFVFNNSVEENLSCLRSQIDIARRVSVISAPVVLLDGKIRIGLSNADYAALRSQAKSMCECTINNVDSMMEEKKSGFVTASLITYVGSLLNAPLTVSGFIRGVDKYTPNTTLDMDAVRKYRVTNVNCGFSLTTDLYSTMSYLSSNQINLVTPGHQFVSSVYNHSSKLHSDITTYSFSELATLLVNNEQLHFPSTHIISLHSKDTTRTLLVEKLFPEVEFETEKKMLGMTQKEQLVHQVVFLQSTQTQLLNAKSNGISKKLFVSCLKEVTKTAALLLQRVLEQRRVVQLKSLLEKEESFSERENETESSERQEMGVPPETVIATKSSSFFTFFNPVENSCEAERESSFAGLSSARVSFVGTPPGVQHAPELLSSSYFLKSNTPRDKNLSCFCHSLTFRHLSPYKKGSPIFIGEVAMGHYHQQSLLPSRSGFVFHDVGGVARNTYEAFLRQMPENRPILMGVVGKDEEGRNVREFHRQLGDDLAYVREEEGRTASITGFYDSTGMKEVEYRCDDHVPGVSSQDISKHAELIKSAPLVFVDSSVDLSALRDLRLLLASSPHRLLVDPLDERRAQVLLDSQILQCTDFVLPSVEELWSFTCLLQPKLKPRLEEWNEKKEGFLKKRSDVGFSEAVLHLKEPVEVVMRELPREKDCYILLKMGRMGMAMFAREAGMSDVDVVHFTVEHNYTPTFESNIAYEEAFAGGFMSGLMQDYPLNLSMAIGINTLKVNSRQKRIIADSIRKGIHSHFIKAYMRSLWG